MVHRLNDSNTFVSYDLIGEREVTPLHVDIALVDDNQLDVEKFKSWRPELADAKFETLGRKILLQA